MSPRIALALLALLVLGCRGKHEDGDGDGADHAAQQTTVVYRAAPGLPEKLADQQRAARYGDENWLLYGGNYGAWRYSSLKQITKENVKNLQVAWQLKLGLPDAFEASPIIVNGVMYFTGPWSYVYAADAKTGKLFWRYVYPLPRSLPLCCGAVNRGVAVGHGKVFFGSLDGHIVALDARTGSKLWDTEAADFREGYSFTVAPQVIDDKVIIGVSGGDFGVRGFIDAYDVKSGKRRWRFWTVPGPGEPGHETWAGNSWKTGGAPAWMPVTYDAKTNLVYAGLGNPGPDLDGENRKGDNLYSESTVALDGNSGKLRWHFQFLPHDVWDLDNVTETVIADITLDGQQRHVGMVAGKNGFFYVLDAVSGKCYYAIQYVHKVNWGKVDPDCTPHPDPNMFPVRDRWTVVYPGASGGKEWVPVAYDPERRRLFIPAIELPHRHKMMKQQFKPGLNYWGGVSAPVPGEGYGHLVAVDVEHKRLAWDKRTRFPLVSGIAVTASGLVITGTPDQKMQIYDADDGKILFEFIGTSGWHSAPTVYAVDGKQYIAFPNGWGGWVTGYDTEGTPMLGKLPVESTLYVFALPSGKAGARAAREE